jgi:hypothetical protein
MEWLMQTVNVFEVTWGEALLALLLFAMSSAGGLALVSFLLVKMPAAYFCDGCRRDFWVESHPLLHWTGL